MNSFNRISLSFALAGFIGSGFAAEPPTTNSAAEIAAQLSGKRESGSTDVRLRMELQPSPAAEKATFQIQIKERRTSAGADVAYVILWPKERKGEALLVRQRSGSAPVASVITLDGKSQSIGMNQPVFGSNLAVADTIENFYSWKNQAIIGSEEVNQVSCQILESKPGNGDSSIYSRVLSWVDPKRLVPLKVEKYLSGKLARRIETTRVVPQGRYGNLPADLTVREPGKESVTKLDGSRIQRDVSFADADFTIEGLRRTSSPQP